MREPTHHKPRCHDEMINRCVMSLINCAWFKHRFLILVLVLLNHREMGMYIFANILQQSGLMLLIKWGADFWLMKLNSALKKHQVTFFYLFHLSPCSPGCLANIRNRLCDVTLRDYKKKPQKIQAEFPEIALIKVDLKSLDLQSAVHFKGLVFHAWAEKILLFKNLPLTISDKCPKDMWTLIILKPQTCWQSYNFQDLPYCLITGQPPWIQKINTCIEKQHL